MTNAGFHIPQTGPLYPLTQRANKHKVAVYIGRFQPFHIGHLALLMQALATGEKVIVVLGSSFQARTTKNPFKWKERARMISLSVSPEERKRLFFLPVRDYYDTEGEGDRKWVAAIRAGVASIAGQEQDIALVGHHKDASSYYLNNFPGWKQVECDRVGELDATSLRKIIFKTGRKNPEAALSLLADYMPAGARDYLEGWMELPCFDALVQEWKMQKQAKKKWEKAPYAPTFVTVDALIICAGHVLLVRRGRAPGKDLYAVPGGFLDQNETLYQGAIREMREESRAQIDDETLRKAFKGAYVYAHPNRSLRGRTVTHLHVFELDATELYKLLGSEDPNEGQPLWMPLYMLADMEEEFFEDHFHMLDSRLNLTANHVLPVAVSALDL